jgi:hypothetical protein
MLLAAVESLVVHKPIFLRCVFKRTTTHGGRKARPKPTDVSRRDGLKTSCGGVQQQEDQRDAKSQHQDNGDAPGGSYAQTWSKVGRRSGSIRGSQ